MGLSGRIKGRYVAFFFFKVLHFVRPSIANQGNGRAQCIKKEAFYER